MLRNIIQALKIFVVITLISFVFQLVFENSLTWESAKPWIINNFVFTFAFHFFNLYLVGLIGKWIPWEINPKRRAILGGVITILANLVIIYVVLGILSYYVYDGPFNYAITERGKWTSLICFIIVLIISLLFHSIAFFKEMQKEYIVNETLRRDKITAELNALKAQVDPHFLFNSFNVLSGLIDESPDEAQKFLLGLSNIYRYVLEHRNEDLVPLTKELDFAQKYMDLHQVRFEDSINVDIDVNARHMDKTLPALSLQLLLENVIKHNAFDKGRPLTVSIKSNDNQLYVSNSTNKRIQAKDSNGIGLDNIRQRYELHKVEGFDVVEEAQLFTVKLPLI